MNEQNENDWINALSFARSTLSYAVASDEQLKHLAQASESIDHFTILIKAIYQYSKSHPDPSQSLRYLFNQVDESDYGLDQWIKAYAFFDQWLVEQKLTSDLVTMLGYLGCCSLSPENKTHKRDLCGLLVEMLKEHGFQ